MRLPLNELERFAQYCAEVANNNVFISNDSVINKNDIDIIEDSANRSLLDDKATRLFHYYPDIDDNSISPSRNYSREALLSGTVYVSCPSAFNDPFECTAPVHYENLEIEAIKQCAKIIGMERITASTLKEAAEEFLHGQCSQSKCELINSAETETKQAVKLFKLAMECSAQSRSGAVCYKDVIAGAREVVNCAVPSFDSLRIFCMTKSYLNQMMWAYYARGHRGFCVEYDRSDGIIATQAGLDSQWGQLVASIRPVIYGISRPDCTKIVADGLFHSVKSEEVQQYYTTSLCRKALYWGLEDEMRLILNKNDSLIDSKGLIHFLPVKAVYAGALMEDDRFASLKDICYKKHFPLYRMKVDEHTYQLIPEIVNM